MSMDRLQRKCFIGSATLHLLLLSVLLFGAAFLPQPKPQPATIIHMYDPRTVTDAATHGGNPVVNVGSLPQSAENQQQLMDPPPPIPAPPRPRTPEVPQPVRRTTPPESRPVVEPPKKNKVVINPDELKPVKPKTTTAKTKPKSTDTTNDAEQQAREQKAEQQRVAKAFGSAIKSIDQNTSGKATVAPVDPGVGGDGPAAINYRDLVGSRYTLAWVPPADLDDETATATARVTIAHDGTVINANIINPSGNASMDKSVRATLENVTYIEPFPAGAKEEQRTYTIKFNLKAKRAA